MGMLFWNRCVGTVVSCSVLCNLFACNKMELKDIDTKQQIENYMEEFRNMYMSEICGLEQKIFIDVHDIYVDNFGYPLELTVYKNDKEEVIRYKVQLYGETGNSVTDYYLCKEFVYVNQEKEYYSSQILVEEYNDVLYRETNDWIIYGDEIYILQDNGQMKIDNNYSFYSIDKVKDWGKEE